MNLTLRDLEQAIHLIHAAPPMVVLEFTGAGSQALTWLHGVAGSSRTVLEATDRYAARSLIDLIGFEPAQFASPAVAGAMATKAYGRARQLTAPEIPVVGIGVTATIATDRAKRGEHRCCVAVCDAEVVTSYTLTLTKGLRSRQEEENLVSLLILRAVAEYCGLIDSLPVPQLVAPEMVVKQVEVIDWIARLLAQEVAWVAVAPDGQMSAGEVLPGVALLPGSFNPLHKGHRLLAQEAANMLGQAVYFELSLTNADKAPISLAEARRRLAQFAGLGTLVLSRAPLFSQKAEVFPHSVFVLGVDTVERLVDPRFYHNDPAEMRASFEAIRRAGCRFLVAGRLRGQDFLTLQDLALPPGYQELFEAIPDFRMDISSTAIRQGRQVDKKVEASK